MNIKYAIFDMDGTIVDSLCSWKIIFTKMSKHYLGEERYFLSPEDDKAIRTIPVKNAMELIHKNYGIASSGSELLDFANAIFVDFYKNQVELKPFAKELLEKLKSEGTIVCLFSATAPELLPLAINRHDLSKYFDKIVSAVDVGISKNSPTAFLEVAKLLNANPSDVWVFEDSVVALESAHKAGMKTVGVYDAFGFDFERMQALSTIYISKNETFGKLL